MNLTPLEKFLQEEITPTELAKLLDEFAFDYIDRFVKLNLLNQDISSHIDTDQFLYMIRRLSQILQTCK